MRAQKKVREGEATVHRVVGRYLKALSVVIGVVMLGACGQIQAPDSGRTPPEPVPVEASWQWSPVGYSDGSLEPTAVQDDFIVSGSGVDIWDERDEFYYVYTPLVGDGSLSVRVADFDATDPWAKAGVMLRDGLDPSARNVLLHISNANGSVMQTRLVAGGTTINTAGHDTTMKTGGWVRLTRSGNTVVGELSTDGTSWRELGRYEVTFGQEALIGLAVTAHSRGATARARFTDLVHKAGPVSVQPDEPSEPTDPTDPTEPSEPTPPEQPAQPAPSKPAPLPGGPSAGAPAYPLPAATLYVATNGNDNNSGRSESAPLRTVTKAATLVRPGDVVYIRGGTYPINVHFTVSGTSASPIIWASYPGETAVFDGSSQAKGTSQDRVWVDGVSYNHFVNFEVRNSPQQGIFVRDSNDNVFHGLVTHGNNGSGIQNYSGNRNVYQYLVTYDNFDTVTTNGKIGEDADGIGISAGDSNVISHVVSYYNSDDGIDAWRSTNTRIEYSVSYDNGRGGNGNGNGFKLGGNSESNYTVAVFNVAFDNRAMGFSQNTGRYITLYNNTAYNNGSGNFDVGSTVTLRNNLSLSGRNNVVSGADSRSNSWDLGISDARLASTDRNSTDFLALRADSPAVDAGVDVGFKYSGSAPDLGALQLSVTLANLIDSQDPTVAGAAAAGVLASVR